MLALPCGWQEYRYGNQLITHSLAFSINHPPTHSLTHHLFFYSCEKVAPIYSHGVLAYDEVIDKMIGEGIVTDGMVIPAGSTLCEELFCIYYVKTPSVLNKVVKHFSQCANSHIPILDDFESTSSASPSRYILHLKSNKRSNGLVHQHENTAVRQHQHQQPLDNDLLVIYVTYQSAWSFEIIRSLLTDSYPTQNLLFYLVQSTDNVEANEGRLYVLPPAAYAEIESTAESVSEEKFVRRRPDIFVISSVDERKGDNTRTQLCHSKSNEGIIRDSTSLQQSDKLLSWHFNCQDYIRESIEEIDPKNILFINGEAVDVTTTSTFLGHQNDEVGNKGKQYNRKYVILNAYNVDKIKGRIDDTSTRRNRNDARDKEHKGEIVVQYLPNAATSLASAPVYRHSDMQLFSDTSSEDSILFANKAAWLLLETRGGEWAANVLSEKKRSVAYLYFRCDRPDRELFFSLLFPLLPTVDSLGACSGSGRSSDQAAKDSRGYIEARFASNYIGQAIHAYKPYKFVIAFENTLVDGYITEKLTNAFLSHSVPIYYGAPDVGKYFNTQAFINCHDFLDLQSCASYVAKVNEDETLYLSYLQAPPMTSVEVWCDFFQALPGVARDRRCQRHLEKSDNDNNIVRNIVNTFDFHAP
jgi:hypothetical protein